MSVSTKMVNSVVYQDTIRQVWFNQYNKAFETMLIPFQKTSNKLLWLFMLYFLQIIFYIICDLILLSELKYYWSFGKITNKLKLRVLKSEITTWKEATFVTLVKELLCHAAKYLQWHIVIQDKYCSSITWCNAMQHYLDFSRKKKHQM